MKNKLMKTLKFGFLIFGISLFFTNCDNDEIVSENDNNTIINTDSIANNNPFGFTIQTLELKDIESNTEVFDEIENIKNKSNKSNKANRNNKSLKTVYSSDESFIIDTGIVKYMQNQDSTYHSYTFPVYRANNNSGLENLMLSSQDDGTYKNYIVTYDLTEQEILDLNNNLPVDLKNKVTHTEFKDEQLVNNIFSRESRLPTTIFIVFEGPCDCHTTHAAGGCTHPKSSTSSFTSNTSPGAGHNTSDTGNQSNQNNYNYGGATSPTSSRTIKESLIFYITEIVGLDREQEYFLKSLDIKDLKEIKSFLGNSSSEATEFIKSAVEALMDGGEVDFEEQIINELDGKALCVYNKLKSSSTGFKNAIKKFDGDFPVSHLSFKINNTLPSGNYGITNPPNNFNTTVEFSNTQLSNISDLGGAVAFAHEMIHAEIFRKMLSAAKQGHLNLGQYTTQNRIDYMNSLRNNFPGLYDYYWQRYHPTWNHNLMASHYRGTIADIIEEFDNSSKSRQVYEDLSWAGLRILENGINSIAWDNLSTTEQQRILTNLSNFFHNGTNECN